MTTIREWKAAHDRDVEKEPTLHGPVPSYRMKDHLSIERHPAITVVHLGAEFRSCERQLLSAVRGRLLQLAADIDPPCLLLDFGNTDYFGAEFINAMLRCYKRIKRRDGCFALCRLRPLLRYELECMRLDQLLSIYDMNDEALAAMIPTDGGLTTTRLAQQSSHAKL